MMERDMNKSDSPDAIRKNKLNVDAYLVCFLLLCLYLLPCACFMSTIGTLLQTNLPRNNLPPGPY